MSGEFCDHGATSFRMASSSSQPTPNTEEIPRAAIEPNEYAAICPAARCRPIPRVTGSESSAAVICRRAIAVLTTSDGNETNVPMNGTCRSNLMNRGTMS